MKKSIITILIIFSSYMMEARTVYVLNLNLRQISYSFSLSKQLRDYTNQVDFEIPVDKDYYNKVSVGQELTDNFRFGSLIFKGSFGSWRIKVTNKYTKEVQ